MTDGAATPEMVDAGVKVLMSRFLSLDQLSEFPEIVRTVYAEMKALDYTEHNLRQENEELRTALRAADHDVS